MEEKKKVQNIGPFSPLFPKAQCPCLLARTMVTQTADFAFKTMGGTDTSGLMANGIQWLSAEEKAQISSYCKGNLINMYESNSYNQLSLKVYVSGVLGVFFPS